MRRLPKLLANHGVIAAAGTIGSVLEDRYARLFDRRYHVTTSGYIDLTKTSLSSDAAKRGHRYRAVNAWAFDWFLRRQDLSKSLTFVDLGCGMGRACLIAARHGFARVTGIDMVPEFCAVAERNARVFRNGGVVCSPIAIITGDAVAYSLSSEDDVVFLYNPFPATILEQVVANLTTASRQQRRDRTLIYSERLLETSATRGVLERLKSLTPVDRYIALGQAFYVFRLNVNGQFWGPER